MINSIRRVFFSLLILSTSISSAGLPKEFYKIKKIKDKILYLDNIYSSNKKTFEENKDVFLEISSTIYSIIKKIVISDNASLKSIPNELLSTLYTIIECYRYYKGGLRNFDELLEDELVVCFIDGFLKGLSSQKIQPDSNIYDIIDVSTFLNSLSYEYCNSINSFYDYFEKICIVGNIKYYYFVRQVFALFVVDLISMRTLSFISEKNN